MYPAMFNGSHTIKETAGCRSEMKVELWWWGWWWLECGGES